MLWEPELAPTGALFQEAVEHVARKLGRAKEFPTTPLPDDRAAAVARARHLGRLGCRLAR